jgi:hypothetical protein
VRSPACCQASVAITVVAAPFADDDPTTVYVRRPESRLPPPPRLTRSVRPASVTWLEVQPDELLEPSFAAEVMKNRAVGRASGPITTPSLQPDTW